MSKATYDRLKQVSQDCRYQVAIDELFRISVPENQVQKPQVAAVMVSALLGLAALSGLVLLAISR